MLGLAHLKSEGAPQHPDDVYIEDASSPEEYYIWYEKQLNAYADYYKLERQVPYFKLPKKEAVCKS
jgi:hypothetical protein